MSATSGALKLSHILFLLLISMPDLGLSRVPSAPPPDLKSMKVCTQLGHQSLSRYQRVLPILFPGKTSLERGLEKFILGVTDDDSAFIPLYSSVPLHGRPNPSIQTAVIFLHGLGSNANTYFCTGLNTASKYSNVAVISPWFGTTQVCLLGWTVLLVSYERNSAKLAKQCIMMTHATSSI